MKKGDKTRQNSIGSTVKEIKQKQHLISYFEQDNLLAWQLLDVESELHIELNITIEKVTFLTSLYMKIIERLNSKQDPRQAYFSFKMQKLMSEPYVIRCFNSEHEQKRGALDHKRKELQQKLQLQKQKHNHIKVVEQVLIAQNEKQKKIKQKIINLYDQHEKQLKQRIKKRNDLREYRSSISPQRMGSIVSEGDLSPRRGWTNSNPKLPTNRLHHQHSNIEYKSSDFELKIQEESQLRRISRQVDEEQQLQLISRKLFGK